MLKTVLERLQSPVTLVALLGQVLLLVGLFTPELSDTVKTLGTVVMESLTILGVLNNPTDKNSF